MSTAATLSPCNNVNYGLRHLCPQRSRNVLVHGERRSANRKRWSSPEESGPGMPGWRLNSQAPHELVAEAGRLYDIFMDMDKTAAANLERVQSAMRQHQVGPHCFAGSTGYGHGDIGRSTFDKVFSEVLGTDSCMARVSFTGADHALSTALFGCLRPQDHVTFLTGRPSQSTRPLIQGHPGCLAEWGISCSHIDLTPDGMPDTDAYHQAFAGQPPSAVVLQRAPDLAPSITDPCRQFLSMQHIRNCLEAVRVSSSDNCPLIIVDNRNSEFVEPEEPGALDVDAVTGTLLSSIGGSIVPSGGYVAGKRIVVEKACSQLCAPGMSLDSGAVSGETLRLMFQGLFLAPGLVSEARKGALLLRHKLQQQGITVPYTPCNQVEAPFVSLNLGSEVMLQAMLDAVNAASPFQHIPAQPRPPEVDNVRYAGGSFIQGCMADVRVAGIMQSPFPCVLSGGTHWSQWINVLAHLQH